MERMIIVMSTLFTILFSCSRYLLSADLAVMKKRYNEKDGIRDGSRLELDWIYLYLIA